MNTAETTPSTPSTAPPAALPARPSTPLVGWLSAAVVLLAVGGYALTGSPRLPSAGPPGMAQQAGAANEATNEAASQAELEARFTAVLTELAQKLKEQPENAEGWAMLARSYERLGRTADALPAYAKALALNGQDAQLLTDYADALAQQNGHQLAGEPTVLILKALQIQPDHPKALALAGAAAFDRQDFPQALKHWEQLRSLAPPGSDFLVQLQASIDEARRLGGLPPSPPSPLTANGPAAATAPATPGAPPGAAAAAAAQITGTVSLAPALAAQVAPDDTVFILARPASGSRMPLAIMRRQVKDLPIQFHLDDSMAMAPTARLSLFERVVVVARVSKSGQAAPAAGDLQIESSPVSNRASGLLLEISQPVKN